jgi:hypothetical protein
MAAPHPRLLKQLSAPGLLKTIRRCFDTIPDHRQAAGSISLGDALMSGLAVFGLKYPSLLQFDQACQEGTIRHNLRTLYDVERAPGDTQLRTLLDPVSAAALHPAFQAIHHQIQRHKGLEAYAYLEDHYLVLVDGTGQFSSSHIGCPECGVKNTQAGPSYYHQLLGAVLAHPDLKTVLPFAPEAITRQDGGSKNDCERSAAKRLLKRLRQQHPLLKLIVVEDSLFGNAPHLQLLKDLNLRFIIGVKEGDHGALFEVVQERLCAGACQEVESVDDQGVVHGFRFVNDLPLNPSHPERRVNFLEYWQIAGDQELRFTWITDIELTPHNVTPIMKGGRARWKVENETFNTLKTQGYHLEHNYGHGQQHLSTVFACLMMLAFLVDQTQELCCRVFQRARARFRSRTTLWERLRGAFIYFEIPDWKTLWDAIATGSIRAKLTPNTS